MLAMGNIAADHWPIHLVFEFAGFRLWLYLIWIQLDARLPFTHNFIIEVSEFVTDGEYRNAYCKYCEHCSHLNLYKLQVSLMYIVVHILRMLEYNN